MYGSKFHRRYGFLSAQSNDQVAVLPIAPALVRTGAVMSPTVTPGIVNGGRPGAIMVDDQSGKIISVGSQVTPEQVELYKNNQGSNAPANKTIKTVKVFGIELTPLQVTLGGTALAFGAYSIYNHYHKS